MLVGARHDEAVQALAGEFRAQFGQPAGVHSDLHIICIQTSMRFPHGWPLETALIARRPSAYVALHQSPSALRHDDAALEPGPKEREP